MTITAPGEAPLTIGVVRATTSRRVLSAAIDLTGAGATLALVAQVGRFGVGALILSAIGLLAYGSALLTMLRRRGVTPGRLLLGLRTIDDLTAGPPLLRASLLALAGRERSAHTIDVRRGRDPWRVSSPRPVSGKHGARVSRESQPYDRGERPLWPTTDHVVSRPRTAPDAATAVGVVIVFDSGQRITIDTTMLVGRYPERSAGPTLALPDLSRSLSKTHARLEWQGARLWVTDLGSASGTTVVSVTGQRSTLKADARTPVELGGRVELGDRSFVVSNLVDR